MPERNRHHPKWAEQERGGDLAWVQENLFVLWPLAERAYVSAGKGLLVIDLTVRFMTGHPIFYMPEEQIGTDINADTKRMLDQYDPDWELVIVLLKERNRSSTYRVGIPDKKPR